MSFFDKKEDVLDIQLTKHGKKLLSQGKLKPAYYAFFDDDILYDGNYAGNLENQSDIEPRIFDSLRTKVQTTISGVDKDNHDQELMLLHAIGTAESNAEYAPAWNVKLHMGTFVSAAMQQTGSFFSASVPQVDYKIEFKTKIKLRDTLQEDDGPPGHDLEGVENASYLFDFESQTFSDGSYVKVEGEPVLLEIKEENAPFMKENFEFEVFYINDSLPDERLIPLKFSKGDEFDTPRTNEVEYFLDILCDDEIEDEYLCSIKTQRDRRNIFLPNRLDCREIPPFEGEENPVYITPEPDDGEIC